jgi:hypothetical protein
MTQELEIKTPDKKDRDLLNNWHPHISNAMQQLHLKFKIDSKFILTESDLKCWLFFYLQQEKIKTNSPPFSVHTEITHYAEHTVRKKPEEIECVEVKIIKRKHKFRDLSLLCPEKIEANESLLQEGTFKKDILSKGFLHKAPAIHFELKFIRENGQNNQVAGLRADVKKINNYHPHEDSHIRDFVIVCGSRSINTTVEVLAKELDKIEDRLKDRVRFYLFDKDNILSFKYDGKKFKGK